MKLSRQDGFGLKRKHSAEVANFAEKETLWRQFKDVYWRMK
jgi:hypothetical protein